MTNLGLKTLNIVPCYHHHTLPTLWAALNTTSLNICRTMFESGHMLAPSIRNALSCCKPPTPYQFLNHGNEIKVKGADEIHCDIPSHSSENGYFDVDGLLKTGYFHLTRYSPTD
ncbi:UNVERIFIED_CONTAM: hypothetical protein NCL1_17247 [Trichonephila clavipes]